MVRSTAVSQNRTKPMRLVIRALSGLLLISVSSALAADEPVADFGKEGRVFLEKFCIGCHGGKSPKGEMSLEPYRDNASVVKKRKVWDNVLKMIATGEMPPEKKPRPSVAEAEAFTALVKAVFDHADKNAKPDPGRVTMRRLNRVEYRNTIRDLIGVKFDPTEDFPSDDIGHGFDNIGDVLTLSPVLMERYLEAADTIMSQAITPNPPAVPTRHLATIFTEPASADVATKVIERGFRRVASDGKDFIEIGPINTPYVWDADAEYTFRTRVFGETGNGKPLKVVILVHGENLPDPSPDAELAMISGKVLKKARILKTFEVMADKPENAEVLEVRVPPMPNRHRMIVGQVKPAQGQPPTKLFVEYLALDGPLDTRPASHRRLLAATEGKPQAEQTREVMSRFLRRAFRRPPEPEELARSIQLVETALASGEKWESAIQLAMQGTLCLPKFLFHVELDDQTAGSTVRALDEFQLASRLSYFLWSTMPDDTLLDIAEKKELTANLDAQVRRMLADPRAQALVQNFAMQWLQVKRIEFISPDGQLFPAFNVKLRGAMLRETELFVESILREDRS